MQCSHDCESGSESESESAMNARNSRRLTSSGLWFDLRCEVKSESGGRGNESGSGLGNESGGHGNENGNIGGYGGRESKIDRNDFDELVIWSDVVEIWSVWDGRLDGMADLVDRFGDWQCAGP